MANRGSFGSYSDNYGSYNTGRGNPAGADNTNDFTRLAHVVGTNIQKITNNVAQMQRIVGQIGTDQDTSDLRDKLHQTQHYTNQLAKDTNRSIKDLSHLPAPSNQSDQRQRKMQKERLMNEFSTTLNNFQVVQRNAAARERDSVQRARASSTLISDPFADDKKSDDQLFGMESPSAQVLQMEQDVDLQMINERENAIKQLESDITDVNQIFKDLGMLVHEQGEVIDSIEANVESAAVHVESGREQLSSARNYQSAARKKKLICAVIVVVILIILIVIIVVAVKQS